MAQDPKQQDNSDKDDCRLFFVYGTLRDDLTAINPKDHIAYYANQWFEHDYEACYGELKGYRIYRHKNLPYPFVVETNNDNDVVLGRVIRFTDEKLFAFKLQTADSIEGYDADDHDNDSNLYQRKAKYATIVKYPYKTKESKFIKDKYPKDDKKFKIGSQHKVYFYYQKKDAKKVENDNKHYDFVDSGDWLKRPSHHRHVQFVDSA